MDKKETLIIGLTGNILSDQRMQRIATALLENGWRVQVYYRNFIKYGSKKSVDKNEYPYYTKGISTPFKGGITFYLYYNVLLFLKLLFKPVHTLYAVDADTLPSFVLLSIIKRKPLVYDAHEYFAEVPELQASPTKKKIWHWISAIGVRRSTVRFTVGETLAIALSERYGKPFACVRNVPELHLTASTAQLGKPILLYQGALNEGRMLELLIKAMKYLPELHCVLAGEGDLSADLRTEAAGMENIEFKGMMSPSELRILTPQCFAGYNLLEAKNSLSYYYSLSNKYFDYMHAGIPSISSKLPEYEALNAKWTCGVCIENTLEDLVSTLKSWLDNPTKYVELKENAKFAAAYNHWETEKQLLKDLVKP